MSGIIAIVPLRDGTSGKSRLAERFSVGERGRLVGAMARHVCATLAESGLIETVLVVTRDPGFAHRNLDGVGPGVRILEQPDDAPGLNGALDAGRRWARERDADGILIVHADLPMLGVADVRGLVLAETPVAIAPDLHRTGTNALLLRFPASSSVDDRGFVFQFGVGSFAAHVAEADRLGLARETVIMSGTELDLDTIDDWRLLPASFKRSLEQDIQHDALAWFTEPARLAAPGARS